jgi:hypothetical protein
VANPHDLFVRYLVTKGLDSDTQVNKKLQELGLSPVQHVDVTRQISFIEKTLPPYVMKQLSENKQDKEFLKWMSVLGVGEPWMSFKKTNNQVEHSWGVALAIINNESLFLTATSLILKNVPKDDVMELCNMRFGLKLKVQDVDLFRRFFFDPHPMKKEDWKRFLTLQTRSSKKNLFLGSYGWYRRAQKRARASCKHRRVCAHPRPPYQVSRQGQDLHAGV